MKDIEEIGRQVVDAAFQAHQELGPGLLESSYEISLCHEFSLRDVAFETQVSRPVQYKGISLDAGYRLDILVENCIIIELKAVEQILPVHHAQLLTYLKLSNCTLGYLINFNSPFLKQGLKRVVLNHPPSKS